MSTANQAIQSVVAAADTNPQPEMEAAEYPSGEITISMTQGTNNDWDTITIDSKITK